MLKIKAVKGRVIIFRNRKLTLDGNIGNEYEISKEEFQKDKEMQSFMKYLIINNMTPNDKKETKGSIVVNKTEEKPVENVVIKQPEIEEVSTKAVEEKSDIVETPITETEAKAVMEEVAEVVKTVAESMEKSEETIIENEIKVEEVKKPVKETKTTKPNNISKTNSKTKKSNKSKK